MRLPAGVPAGATDVADVGAPAAGRAGHGLDFDTAWARTPARLARAVISTRPPPGGPPPGPARGRRPGAARRPRGPVIFAANHHSHADTGLLLSTLPERFRHKTVVAAAADYFFTTKAKGTLHALAFGAVPMERTRVNRRSADVATDLLADGWSLVIFPEGGRSPDGWAQEFRGGAAYLALRSGGRSCPSTSRAPGTCGRGRACPGRHKSRRWVTFGTPISPDPGEDARRLAARMEAAVAALADERRTDWWTARRRAAGETTPAITGPEAAPGGGPGRWRARAAPRSAVSGPTPPRRGPGPDGGRPGEGRAAGLRGQRGRGHPGEPEQPAPPLRQRRAGGRRRHRRHRRRRLHDRELAPVPAHPRPHLRDARGHGRLPHEHLRRGGTDRAGAGGRAERAPSPAHAGHQRRRRHRRRPGHQRGLLAAPDPAGGQDPDHDRRDGQGRGADLRRRPGGHTRREQRLQLLRLRTRHPHRGAPSWPSPRSAPSGPGGGGAPSSTRRPRSGSRRSSTGSGPSARWPTTPRSATWCRSTSGRTPPLELRILFDSDHTWEERILREQFTT